MKAKIKNIETTFRPVTLEVIFESSNELMALYLILNHTVLTDAAAKATNEGCMDQLDELHEALEPYTEDYELYWDEFCTALKEGVAGI